MVESYSVRWVGFGGGDDIGVASFTLHTEKRTDDGRLIDANDEPLPMDEFDNARAWLSEHGFPFVKVGFTPSGNLHEAVLPVVDAVFFKSLFQTGT